MDCFTTVLQVSLPPLKIPPTYGKILLLKQIHKACGVVAQGLSKWSYQANASVRFTTEIAFFLPAETVISLSHLAWAAEEVRPMGCDGQSFCPVISLKMSCYLVAIMCKSCKHKQNLTVVLFLSDSLVKPLCLLSTAKAAEWRNRSPYYRMKQG